MGPDPPSDCMRLHPQKDLRNASLPLTPQTSRYYPPLPEVNSPPRSLLPQIESANTADKSVPYHIWLSPRGNDPRLDFKSQGRTREAARIIPNNTPRHRHNATQRRHTPCKSLSPHHAIECIFTTLDHHLAQFGLESILVVTLHQGKPPAINFII